MISPFNHQSHESEAPVSALEQSTCSSVDAMWREGITPQPLTVNAARDPVVIGILLAVIALVMFNFSSCRRMFSHITQDLWGTRRRENAFDDPTANESRTIILLIVLLCTAQALLTYLHFNPGGTAPDAYALRVTLGLMSLLMSGYFIFLLAAYSCVGWTFTDPVGAQLWIRGYTVSSALLGLILIFPALTAMFYHPAIPFMVGTALFVFILAKLIFIIKGFRIFYRNFFSLLYFILYLCALEIIPLIIVYAEASALCKLVL